MKFKAGDKGRTRDGRPYEVLEVGEGDVLVAVGEDFDETPVFNLTLAGRVGGVDNPLDLMLPDDAEVLDGTGTFHKVGELRASGFSEQKIAKYQAITPSLQDVEVAPAPQKEVWKAPEVVTPKQTITLQITSYGFLANDLKVELTREPEACRLLHRLYAANLK